MIHGKSIWITATSDEPLNTHNPKGPDFPRSALAISAASYHSSQVIRVAYRIGSWPSAANQTCGIHLLSCNHNTACTEFSRPALMIHLRVFSRPQPLQVIAPSKQQVQNVVWRMQLLTARRVRANIRGKPSGIRTWPLLSTATGWWLHAMHDH